MNGVSLSIITKKRGRGRKRDSFWSKSRARTNPFELEYDSTGDKILPREI